MDYYSLEILRNKPGRGERTISLSCSDKLVRWNLLGLQGTLLFAFIPHPIRLQSLIIGELFEETALDRAINLRSQELSSKLPQIFQIQSPCQFYQTTELFEFGKEQIEKKYGIEKSNPSGYSINWSYPDCHEVTIPEGKKMGTTKNSNPKKARSRLCNKEMLIKFLRLVNLASSKEWTISELIISQDQTYLELKRKQKFSTDLQKATDIFFQHFKDWTRTPDHIFNFRVDETDIYVK